MTRIDVGGPPDGDALDRPFTPGTSQSPSSPSSPRRSATDDSRSWRPTRGPASSSRSGATPSYNCFSSGHKFCREVCPVMQVTRNESWTPTAFHANVVAMEQGELEIADVAATTSTAPSAARASCAARTRCSPATSTASAPAPSTWSRRCARSRSTTGSTSRVADAGTRAPTSAPTSRCSARSPVSQEHVRDWADGLGPPDRRRDRSCSSTARRRSTAPRSRARSPRCCSTPATSSG